MDHYEYKNLCVTTPQVNYHQLAILTWYQYKCLQELPHEKKEVEQVNFSQLCTGQVMVADLVI